MIALDPVPIYKKSTYKIMERLKYVKEILHYMFEEFFESESPDVIKGVEIAIKIESKARNFYLNKSTEMQYPDGKDLLNYLAEQEAQHEQVLKILKESLKERGEWLDPDQDLETPKVFELNKTSIKPSSTDNEIILEAISAEAETKKFYEKFSEKIEDKIGKKFFKHLAEFESSHHDLLNKIYYEFFLQWKTSHY